MINIDCMKSARKRAVQASARTTAYDIQAREWKANPMNRYKRASREYDERKRIITKLHEEDPGGCVALFARRKASAEQGSDIPICIFTVAANMLWVVLVGAAAAMIAASDDNPEFVQAGLFVAALGAIVCVVGFAFLAAWSWYKREARTQVMLDELIMRDEGFIS